jgi:hypothetical protein
LLLSFAITSVSKQCWISKQETQFENPVFDYLILAAILLTCILLDICNQYTAFGTLWISNPNPTAIDSFVPTILTTKHLIHRNYWTGGLHRFID